MKRAEGHEGFSGVAVRLEDLLMAREQRAARQYHLMQHYHRSVMCLTLVTPGPVKDNPALRGVFIAGKRAIKAALSAKNWLCLFEETYLLQTGPEAFFVVDAPALALKRALIEVEETHPMGRLWDGDVIVPGFDFGQLAGRTGTSKPLLRKDLGFPPRKCLVCERPAVECARARTHDLAELYQVVARLAGLGKERA